MGSMAVNLAFIPFKVSTVYLPHHRVVAGKAVRDASSYYCTFNSHADILSQLIESRAKAKNRLQLQLQLARLDSVPAVQAPEVSLALSRPSLPRYRLNITKANAYLLK